jgi:hypothetical protein
MAANFLPFDMATETAGLDRKQQLAQLLMQQGLSGAPAGQMVSGHYVSPGILGALAPLAKAYMGQQMQGKIDDQRKGLAGEYNTRLASGLDNYFSTRDGEAGVQASTLAPDQAGPEEVTGFQKADPRKAAVMALTSGMEPLHELGKMDLMAAMKARQERAAAAAKPPAPEKFGHTPVAMKDAQGNLVHVLLGDYGSVKPVENYSPKPEYMTVADRVVNKDDPTKVTADYRPGFSDPFKLGGDLYQKETGTGKINKLDNAPKTTVSVGGAQIINKGEEEFSKVLGAGRAKTMLESEAEARQAHQTLGTIRQLKELEAKGIASGKFADQQVAIGEIVAAFGVPVDANKLANSQAYRQQIAKQVANVLTAGGGVGRSMTDADRVEWMKSLPSMLLTPQGRQQVYSMMENDAQTTIARSRSFQQQLTQNPVYKNSPGMLTLNPVDEYSGPSGPGGVTAPAPKTPVPGRPSGGAKPATETIIKGW